MRDKKPKGIVDAHVDTRAEVKHKTLTNTPAKLKATALATALGDTLTEIEIDTKRH